MEHVNATDHKPNLS